MITRRVPRQRGFLQTQTTSLRPEQNGEKKEGDSEEELQVSKTLMGPSLAVSPKFHQNPAEVSGNLSVVFNEIWSKPPVREI